MLAWAWYVNLWYDMLAWTSMGPRNAYKDMLDKVISLVACVNMNHQNQLEQMANGVMFATDSDRDDLTFAFGNLSITLSSATSSSSYNLVLLFCLICMFNMSSVWVVLTLVAMIYDMLNLVINYIMIYIMVLICKLPNVSTHSCCGVTVC
jgi:hypothetical protein